MQTTAFPAMGTVGQQQPMCRHPNWSLTPGVDTTSDPNRFVITLSAHCSECGKPLVFTGLPMGTDERAARVSPSGHEVRLGAGIEGTVPSPFDLVCMAAGADITH